MARFRKEALPDDVRDAVSYIKTGKPLPSRITRYAGKIKVAVIERGKTTWSLVEEIRKLPDLKLEKVTSWADLIRTIMSFLDQGDEGFAQFVGIPVATIRDWKQGGREPSSAGRRLLDVSIRFPEIMLEIVQQSEEAYA